MGKFKHMIPSPHYSTIFLITFLFTSLIHPSNVHASNQPIKTIVVLVMENRSFDHMLGWMKKSVNPKINGLTGTECNQMSTTDPNSTKVCVSDDAEYVDPDPGHSYQEIKQQIFGSGTTPAMSGFLEQALTMKDNQSEAVMKGFKPEAVPVYASLVREFAVFDRWFASVPSSTQPNRLYVYSATSHGLTHHEKLKLALGLPQKTIFDCLHENGLDFGIYYQNVPSTLFYRNMRKLKYTSKFHQYDLKFKKHAREGSLPRLTVIEPNYFDLAGRPGNDDHPSHDVAAGQRLVKEVYEALRSGPQWNDTLLVITYDEHGGFYDHVPTPLDVPSPDDIRSDLDSFNFDRLGVRVPTIMVSPWINKGIVVSRPNGPAGNSEYEHSSIPATIKKMFNLSSPFLTKRDAWAGTFEQVVGQLSSPRTDCPETLADPVPLRKTAAEENRKLSGFQTEIAELASILGGDHHLDGFSDNIREMTVKEGDNYVTNSVSRFFQANKDAIKMGAHESTIVEMRSSLTSRKENP